MAPTLDLGSRRRNLNERQGQTLDSTQADDAHAPSSASMCAHLMIRQAIRERAAVGRLRLRLRHRSCATTSSFGESASAETPGHHFGDSRCASRSRERTVAGLFTSRLRISPSPYPLRYQDVHAGCTLCRLLAWRCASLYVDVAICRLLARPAVRPTPTILVTVRFETMLQLAASPDDSQHPMARSRVDVRSLLAL